MKAREILEKRLYIDDKGIIVTHEEIGVFPPWGSYRAAYMIDGQGNYTRDWYADHTCSSDVWGASVEPSAVPERARAVLGKPVERVLLTHSNLFEIVRL